MDRYQIHEIEYRILGVQYNMMYWIWNSDVRYRILEMGYRVQKQDNGHRYQILDTCNRILVVE